VSTAMAANHGLKYTLLFVCAVPIGWGLLLSICVFGLGALLLAVPLLTSAIKVIGVGYLLYLAAKLATLTDLFNRAQTPIKAAINAASIGEPARLNVSFTEGVAMQFINIKAWMLALSIVSGWVAGRANPGERFAIVLPVMLAFAFFSNLTYAMVGALLKDWLAGPSGSGQRLMWFNRVMALVLVSTAFWMATL
jgi:threonine/homoserine/homoserine lactone efflux protein